jgi:hypothetical protein
MAIFSYLSLTGSNAPRLIDSEYKRQVDAYSQGMADRKKPF